MFTTWTCGSVLYIYYMDGKEFRLLLRRIQATVIKFPFFLSCQFSMSFDTAVLLFLSHSIRQKLASALILLKLKIPFPVSGTHSGFVVRADVISILRLQFSNEKFALLTLTIKDGTTFRVLYCWSSFCSSTAFKSRIFQVGSWNSVWVYKGEQVLSCQRIFLLSDLQDSSCWKPYLILFFF